MSGLPPVVEALLDRDPPTQESWAAFAREYTALLLHVARSTSRDRDEAMDAYAYLLDRLSEEGCRRLRGYVVEPKSKFTTWLVVVARRLCVDHYRLKYGRLRNEESKHERVRLGLRRRIEDLDAIDDIADSIPDDNPGSAANQVEIVELTSELRNLVKCLDPSDRLLLTLRFDDGLSASEIAGILQYPSQFHVYRRINALLADLRAALEARGFGSAAS
jgi:RNA polymerase sigma factor (sigma-70 family)